MLQALVNSRSSIAAWSSRWRACCSATASTSPTTPSWTSSPTSSSRRSSSRPSAPAWRRSRSNCSSRCPSKPWSTAWATWNRSAPSPSRACPSSPSCSRKAPTSSAPARCWPSKLAETAGNLPASVKTPRMTPLTSSTMDLLKIGLVSDKLTPMELRTFADWTLKPRLLSVPGVAKCSSFGGEVRQLQIQVLPDRLLAYDLALSDVLAAARVSTGRHGRGLHRDQQPAHHPADRRPGADAGDPRRGGRRAHQWVQRPAQGRGARGGRRRAEVRRHRRHGPLGRADDHVQPVRREHDGSDQGARSRAGGDEAGLREAGHHSSIRGCTGRRRSSRLRSGT